MFIENLLVLSTIEFLCPIVLTITIYCLGFYMVLSIFNIEEYLILSKLPNQYYMLT